MERVKNFLNAPPAVERGWLHGGIHTGNAGNHQNIPRCYGAQRCFRLRVKRGTVHALVGENGAGKSTLMKILNGIYPATKGEIYLDGEKLDLHGVRERRKRA